MQSQLQFFCHHHCSWRQAVAILPYFPISVPFISEWNVRHTEKRGGRGWKLVKTKKKSVLIVRRRISESMVCKRNNMSLVSVPVSKKGVVVVRRLSTSDIKWPFSVLLTTYLVLEFLWMISLGPLLAWTTLSLTDPYKVVVGWSHVKAVITNFLKNSSNSWPPLKN